MKSRMILLSVVILFACAQGPGSVFENMTQAACKNDANAALAFLDIRSFVVDGLKAKGKDVNEEAISVASEKVRSNLSQLLPQFCKFKLVSSKANGDTAIVVVEESPYYQFEWKMTKSNGAWLISVSPDGGDPVNPPVQVHSSVLVEDYKSNEVAADNKYKGKVISVAGSIEKIGKDIRGKTYIVLAGGLLSRTQCFLKESMLEKAASLQPGTDINVTGLCDGKFGNVIVNECVF